jgi:hypothetical protein
MKAATRGRTRLSNPAMFNVKGSILVAGLFKVKGLCNVGGSIIADGLFNVAGLFNNNGNLRQADAM